MDGRTDGQMDVVDFIVQKSYSLKEEVQLEYNLPEAVTEAPNGPFPGTIKKNTNCFSLQCL